MSILTGEDFKPKVKEPKAEDIERAVELMAMYMVAEDY